MDSSVITRAAVGNTATLGDMYDARQDDFCGINIFKKTIPTSAKDIVDSNFSDIHFVHSDSYSEKFSKMEIAAELQVSVLIGATPLKGSGRYLTDQKQSNRTLKSSLIYSIRTKDEKVNVYHEDLLNAFAPDAIQSELATHVVVGISWGANSVVSCICPNQESKNDMDIQNEISVYLQSLSFCVSGKNTVNIAQTDINNNSKFELRTYGDVLPQDEELPTTFEGAMKFIRNLPKLVASSNEGKGKPISFKLLPIAVLKNYLNLKMNVNYQVVKLEEASLLRVVQLFDEVCAAQQILHDFCNDVQEYEFCLPAQDLREINGFKNEMIILETSLKTRFCNLLVSIRSGKEDVTKLDEAIENFYSSKLASHYIQAKLESWEYISSKFRFARVLLNKGIRFLKKNETLSETLLDLNDTTIYVLFYSHQASPQNMKHWQKTIQLFLAEQCTQKKEALFLAVNQDVHPSTKPQNCGLYVQVFQKGDCIADHFFGDKTKLEEHLLGIPNKIMWVQDTSSNLTGDILRYAVLAGPDAYGNPTYVCRGEIHDRNVNLVPGSLIVSKTSKTAFIPYNGCNAKTRFEVLVCPPWGVAWQKVTNKRVPTNAIVAGHVRSNEKQYIGRTTTKDGVGVGKVHNYDMKWTGLFYCQGGTEIRESIYEVLVRTDLGQKFNI